MAFHNVELHLHAVTHAMGVYFGAIDAIDLMLKEFTTEINKSANVDNRKRASHIECFANCIKTLTKLRNKIEDMFDTIAANLDLLAAELAPEEASEDHIQRIGNLQLDESVAPMAGDRSD